MNMKNLKYWAMAVLIVTAFGSCKKFLTVTPKTQMPQDILFSTENGFKDALTGVYIQFKSNNTYGQALTQTTLEQLISSWDITTGTTEQQLGLFNYAHEGVQSRFSSIWAQQYKVITSINAILDKIDENKNVFQNPDMYYIIKSECLALRAYCHLDILRLFGPVPGTSASTITLPYAEHVLNSPQTRISIDEFKTKLLKDLSDAETLIDGKDPIQQYSLSQLKNPSISSGFNPKDNFVAYRYLRMNYYAIKAVQARAYLWFGDKNLAYQNAKLVIDAKNDGGGAKFRLGTGTDMNTSTKDYVLSNEHIFGIYMYNLNDTYTSLYTSGTLKKGSAETPIKSTLYGSTGTDIREVSLWELYTLTNGTKINITKKYSSEKSPIISQDFKQIPMIRLSEMYFIAAETAPIAEGIEYFRQFRVARNIGTLTIPTNEPTLATELLKEYRKEFYAEGQAFYAYKRYNAPRTSIIFAPTAAVPNYVVPVPKEETL